MENRQEIIKELKNKLNKTDKPEVKKALELKIKALESGNTVYK